jgi:hypothetical protein
MLRSASLPPWFVLAVVIALVALIIVTVHDNHRRSARRRRRRDRQQRNVVRHRVWNWVMGRARYRRLTFHRNEIDED